MFDWILTTIHQWGYPGLLFLMIAENVFPPIPSELIMPLAGFLAGSGELKLIWVLIAGTIGSVIGTTMWYYVAIAIGEARLKRFAARHGRWLTLSPSDIDTANEWFAKNGGYAVFFGRMLPTIRTLISVPAGFARMPIGKFLALTTAGSFVWIAILTVAGYLLETRYTLVEAWVDPLSKVIVALVVLVYLYRVVTWKPE